MPLKLLAFIITMVSILVGGICALATLGWLLGTPEAEGAGYLVPWWLAIVAASGFGIWYAKRLLIRANAEEGEEEGEEDDEITDLSHRPELVEAHEKQIAARKAARENQEVKIRAAGAPAQRSKGTEPREESKKQNLKNQAKEVLENAVDTDKARDMQTQDFQMTWKYSWMSLLLIALNVAAFWWVNVRNGYPVESLPRDLMLKFGGDAAYLTLTGEFWRILTSTFLHWDLAHLIGNMVGLFYAGRYLEYFVGRKSLFMIFVTTGLLASIGTHLVHSSFVVSAGASGAVFGLYGALLVCFLMSKRAKAMKYNKNLLLVSAYFVGSNLFRGFGADGVNNAAHVAGLLAGVSVAYLIYGLNLKGRVGRYQISGLAVTFSLLVLGFLGVNKDFEKEMNSPDAAIFLAMETEFTSLLDEGRTLARSFSRILKENATPERYRKLPEKLKPVIAKFEKTQEKMLQLQVSNDRAYQLLQAFTQMNHYFILQARIFADPNSFPNGILDDQIPLDVRNQIAYLSDKIEESSQRANNIMDGKFIESAERQLASQDPQPQTVMEEVEVGTSNIPPKPVSRDEIYMSLIQDFVNMDDQFKLLGQQASAGQTTPEKIAMKMDELRAAAEKIELEINTLRPGNEVEANLKLSMLTTMNSYRKMLSAFSEKDLFGEGPRTEMLWKQTELATQEYNQTMPALKKAIERFKQSLVSGVQKESVSG